MKRKSRTRKRVRRLAAILMAFVACLTMLMVGGGVASATSCVGGLAHSVSPALSTSFYESWTFTITNPGEVLTASFYFDQSQQYLAPYLNQWYHTSGSVTYETAEWFTNTSSTFGSKAFVTYC